MASTWLPHQYQPWHSIGSQTLLSVIFMWRQSQFTVDAGAYSLELSQATWRSSRAASNCRQRLEVTRTHPNQGDQPNPLSLGSDYKHTHSRRSDPVDKVTRARETPLPETTRSCAQRTARNQELPGRFARARDPGARWDQQVLSHHHTLHNALMSQASPRV